ncbi:MAG: hypothetical protein IKW33_01830 [Clostridia bacterium]|nr:hypothetical protein [Clostridia bacterium]
MRKKLLKILSVLFTFCMLTAFAITGVMADDGVVFDTPNLTTQYVGNNFEVESLKATVGENEYDTTSIIIFPDGLAYSNDKVYLSQVGTYTIRYTAKINNTTYTKDYTFEVLAQKSLLIEEKNASTYVGYSSYYPEVYGLNVESNASGTVFLKDPINIRSFSKLGEPLIELFAVPSVYGAKDFDVFYIHLIDTADENNEVIFQVTTLGDLASGSYLKGKAPNQIYMGLENGKKMYIQQYGGNKISHAFWGLPDKNNPEDAGKEGTKINYKNPGAVQVWYDDSELAGYTIENTGTFSMVTEFDNPEYYGNVWDGFKSDYVKIGVSIGGTIGSPKYLIKTMGGIDFTKEESITDFAAPLLEINDYATDKTSNPVGVVNRPYKVFDINCYDNLKLKRIKREVRYNAVDGIGGATVPLNDDYTFTPTRVGEYTLFYEAEDLYGNVTTKNVVVEVKDSLEAFTISLADNSKSTINIYQPFGYRDYTVSGGSGVSSVKIYAQKQGSTNKIPLSKEKNRITDPGEYKIYYEAEDYLGFTNIVSYDLTVNGYTTPFLVDDVFMPTAFISGVEADVPTKNALFLENNKYVEVEPKITAKLGNSSIAINKGKIQPVVTSEGELELTYTYTYKNTTKVYPYKVPVVNVGKQGSLQMDKYFVISDGFNVTKSVLGIDYETSTSNSEIAFVKTLSSKSFEVQFSAESNLFETVDYIELLLFDGVGEVSLKMMADGKALINDTIDAFYKYSVTGTYPKERYNFHIVYNESTNALMHTGGEDIAIVKTYRDGSAFESFANEQIGFKLNFGTVKTAAKIRISYVNKQLINRNTRDSYAAQYAIDAKVGGMFERNEKLVLYPVVAWDVLGEVQAINVTVKDANEKVVTATNGVKLNNADGTLQYIINGKSDVYRVYYSIVDSNGNTIETERKYTCTSGKVLNLKYSFKLPKTAKVNDEISLKEVKSSSYQAFFYVIDPSGDIHLTEVSYKFKKKGTYVIRLFAFNDDYYMSYVDHKIVVE